MSKKTTSMIAVIVLLVMILAGTFAWTQYNQHKTNEANGPGLRYDVSLIEDFEEIENWQASSPAVKKEIRVKNSGLTDGSYGDVYVRLQLKEYMEMSEIIYTYSKYRYMIGTNGKFITYDSEAAALADYPGHTANLEKGLEDTVEQWYVQTQAGDDNGQYGKFLILSASSGDAIPLVEDTEKATDTESHDLATNGECAYPEHVWSGDSHEDCELGFHDYISWYLGGDVISIKEWENDYDSLPVEAWIYDTASTEGWVYWGASLAPGKTTSNLLEAIKLIKQPDDNFYYALHVDMEAVSLEELIRESERKWTDAPAGIRTALTTPIVAEVEIEAAATVGTRSGTVSFAALVKSFNGALETVEWTVKATDGTETFSVLTTGSNNTSDGSTIDENGVLSIAPGETADKLKVTATSVYDSMKSASVTIDVAPLLITGIDITPATITIARTSLAPVSMAAVVNGTGFSDQTVEWSVSGNTSEDTTIDEESGVLTVAEDETSSILIVTATYVYDKSKTGSTEVLIIGDNDGVDFSATTGLLASGNSIYYGTYDHATGLGASGTSTSGTVYSRRGEAEPIQWQVMGNSDGNITVMSRYVLDSIAFFPFSGTPTQNINYWRDSNVRAWLNNMNYTAVTEAAYTPSSPVPADYTSTGFLNNFFTSEQNQIADTTVNTTNYTYNSLPSVTSAAISTTEKIYLPWGTQNTGSTGYQNRVWWSVDDSGLSSYATGSATTDEITSKIGYLKPASGTGNGTAVTWWLRSPYSYYVYGALYVTTSGSVINANTLHVYGVRPVFRLNPESVIFASEVVAATDGYEVSATAKNYKLTVLNESLGTLTGVPTASQVTTAAAGLTLTGLESSQTGSDYSINYKIVDVSNPANHTIVSSGATTGTLAASDNSLTMNTSGLNGQYLAYVWLQKNNSINSNEAVQPQCFLLTVN